MSLADVFGREDRTEVKFSEFFALVKQAAQYETLMNAVNCDVPHRFIRETMTGKKETAPKEPGTVVTVTFDTEEFEKGTAGSNRADRSKVRTGRGRSRTGAGSHRTGAGSRGTGTGKHGKGTAGSNRGKYSGSGRGSHLQRVERRTKHGSGRNYLFYRGSSRRNGWPCGLRRTPCEPE